LENRKRKWELKNNIKMDIREVGCQIREIHGTRLRTDTTDGINVSESVPAGKFYKR
jgi:hypothetical protein